MKNVRIFYTKGGRLRFVSHLDMTRFMTRMLRRTGLPVWYTEGFHPHLYLTFALPLSLGFESNYEVMDIRLEDDSCPPERVCEALNAVFPEDIRALYAAEPVLKTGKIAFARFEIRFLDGGALAEPLRAFLARGEIPCTKKTKRGAEKQLDLAPKLGEYTVTAGDAGTVLEILLPAGGEDNVNPELLIGAFLEECPSACSVRITRTQLLDAQKQLFR